MSRSSSTTSRTSAPISYTVVQPLKKNSLQVQRLVGDRDTSSIQTIPVYNITKMHTKKDPCKEVVPKEYHKAINHVFNVEPYNNENIVAQYNECGILFSNTDNRGIWRFEKKKLSGEDYELKVVDQNTSEVIARWRKSHSKYGGWTLKRQSSGERTIIARYHEDENILDIFPYNFKAGEDIPFCQYYEQLNPDIKRSKYDNPALFSSPLFLSDSILLTFLGLRLYMDIGDEKIAPASSSLINCPLTPLLVKQNFLKRFHSLASSPINASKFLLHSRQHV